MKLWQLKVDGDSMSQGKIERKKISFMHQFYEMTIV